MAQRQVAVQKFLLAGSLPRLTPAMDLWFHVEPLTSDALRLQARTPDPASTSQNLRRKKHAGTIF